MYDSEDEALANRFAFWIKVAVAVLVFVAAFLPLGPT